MSGIKNIVIGGGRGGIGSYLTRYLMDAGYNVKIISRSAKLGNRFMRLAGVLPVLAGNNFIPTEFLSWKDIQQQGLPLETDVVINLAGQSIGSMGVFNKWYKLSVEKSRITPTTDLVQAIKRMETPPKLFISASAVGIYGLDPDKVYTEADEPAGQETRSYFTDLCKTWEKSSELPAEVPTRVVNTRFGVVLGFDLEPVKKLINVQQTVLGSGDQPFPWVHIDDLLAIFSLLLESDDLSGPVNCVAPQLIDNAQLANSLARACYTPGTLLHMPASIIRLFYGTERADNLFLNSPKVAPQKLTDAGFTFKYPTIRDAADALVHAKCNDPQYNEGNNPFARALKQRIETQESQNKAKKDYIEQINEEDRDVAQESQNKAKKNYIEQFNEEGEVAKSKG